jgi:hypothetical protein
MSRKVFLDLKSNHNNFEGTIINKNNLNSRKLNLIKELIIWFICLAATSIGPILLINAPYDIAYTITAAILLGICCAIYHFIVKRLKHPYISIFGLCTLYGYFIYFMANESSFKFFLRELFRLRLGGDGFLTISMMHLLWGIIIIKHLLTGFFSKESAMKILQCSFEYWAVIMISLLIIRTEILTNSGEGKVIIGNIFLLYGFLQQFIDGNLILRSLGFMKSIIFRFK